MLKRFSLKQRLLLLVLTATIGVWLVEALLTYNSTRHEVNELLDAHLAQAASILAAQSLHEMSEIRMEHAPRLKDDSRQVAFQVWEQGKKLRLHSANAPEYPLTEIEDGFADIVIDGQKWRVYSVWNRPHNYLIHVAELADMRDRVAGTIAYNLLFPLLLSLPILTFLLWLAVTRGLHPLVKLTREIAVREPDALVPFNSDTAPREVLPMIAQLNRLFGRIDALIQKERRFTADAAHELRTPIAGIKAQAQVAQAASTAEARENPLKNVILGCDRAAHLIDQLLTLARLDALDEGKVELCHLRLIAAEAIAAIVPKAHGKGVQIELLSGTEAVVRGNPGLMKVLLRNLLDNAVKHNPSGTVVQVAVVNQQGNICLSVSDNGSGLPEAECHRVIERFYRPTGTQASGSGLGLSIVKRIAEIHAADLRIMPQEQGNGLRVEVVFKVG